MVLTERDRAILDFERSWWSEPGRKELAIRERFDLSTTRYYGILNELLDAPEALEYDPLVVRRLRRVRSPPPGPLRGSLGDRAAPMSEHGVRANHHRSVRRADVGAADAADELSNDSVRQ